jgi:hypothetical protein
MSIVDIPLMDVSWNRGVYVDGAPSTWGTTPVVTMAHQLLADLRGAIRHGVISADVDITIATHVVDGMNMVIVRIKSDNELLGMHQFRKMLGDFVRELMTRRATQHHFTGILNYYGLVALVKSDDTVVESFNHFM